MIKVITYGTYDLMHEGHIRLLLRAKALGDYLIVGVTAEDFDRKRGKINVQQTLMQRIEAVRQTGLADEIIVEEYEGQKIDDIKKYNIDIFTVGSDWKGHFDYLKEFCEVIYLPRTEGISSTDLRSEKRSLKIGIYGDADYIEKFVRESKYVDGVEIIGIYKGSLCRATKEKNSLCISEQKISEEANAIYLIGVPDNHYLIIKKFLQMGKHVLCEAPICLNEDETVELYQFAAQKGLVLMEAIKTAYATAYARLCLLAKSGIIGRILSVDAICTSLQGGGYKPKNWNALCAWGPTALLPVFQLLGTEFKEIRFVTWTKDKDHWSDEFTKIDFVFDKAVASIKVGVGVKSEGELIISGTKGYIYVPAPWWKTDYFEIRYEDTNKNRRYFYQLEGEGIRNEILAFTRAIASGDKIGGVSEEISGTISKVVHMFKVEENVVHISN